MNIGDFVKRKGDDQYGIAAYSPFGLSIHLNSHQHGVVIETLGTPADDLYEYWEVVREIPRDWTLDKHGIPIRTDQLTT